MAEQNGEQILTPQEADLLEMRELNVHELEAQVDSVWETVERMQEAETVSQETLTFEISI
jgi:hypothetical protein